MTQLTRAAIALLATLAALAGTVALPATATAGNSIYVNGVEYEYVGEYPFGDGSESEVLAVPVDAEVLLATRGVGSSGCKPNPLALDISDPTYVVYHGTPNYLFRWSDWGHATPVGCDKNHVIAKARLIDQALDGSSPPTVGAEATASGVGRVSVEATLDMYYPYLPAGTGGDYHALTMVLNATDESGLKGCATKTWMYRPTPAGPYYLGETAQAKC